MDRITVRNLPFDNVNMDGALSLAEKAIETRGVSLAVTPNAEIAELCIRDEALQRIVASADLVLPDGEGVILASKILGKPLQCKVAGVEFGERLLSLAAERSYKVFLLGGKPNIADAAAKALMSKYIGLSVVGTHDGYFEKFGEANEAVIDEINRSEAVILLVCLGAPLQEKWIAENKEKLTFVRLAACLGGSLDVYAGTVKRAPKLFIRLRAEWLYRLIKEPKRLGRMLTIPRYLLGARKEKRKNKPRKGKD